MILFLLATYCRPVALPAHPAAGRPRGRRDLADSIFASPVPGLSYPVIPPSDTAVMTNRASAVRCTFEFQDKPAGNPGLVADLRHARARRGADRYEWLALRRRRAQIAARHALDRCEA
jgi:hypothetical protein